METQFYHRPGCSKNPLNLGIGNVVKYFTTFTSFTCQSAAESASLRSSFVAGSPLVFGIRDLAFLKPAGIQDSKEYWERDSGL